MSFMTHADNLSWWNSKFNTAKYLFIKFVQDFFPKVNNKILYNTKREDRQSPVDQLLGSQNHLWADAARLTYETKAIVDISSGNPAMWDRKASFRPTMMGHFDILVVCFEPTPRVPFTDIDYPYSRQG